MAKRRVGRRTLLKVPVALALGSIGSGAYAHALEPDWVELTRVSIKLPRLGVAFDGYQIVHISDIHMDGWMDRARLAQHVAHINQQQPDLVAITGDFVSFTPERFAPDLVAALSELRPRDGTVAVLGNHDHWTKPGFITRTLTSAGIVVLRNAVHTIRRDDDELHLGGVDDITVHEDRLDQVLDQLPATGAAILLAHEPDFADISAATRRFGLQLSGHSHGGQVRVPFAGAPMLPPYAQKYPLGRYQIDQMTQYTNRGLGVLQPRLRFNCRPEITVLSLRV